MKKILTWLVALAVMAGCATEKPETPPKLYSIAQFMDIVQINGGAFSPDETKLLISSKETGIFNAVEVDLATGKQTPLTNSADNAVYGYSYFPKDTRVLYGSDKGGNEITHLFALANGVSTDLITDSTAKAQFYGWSYNQKLMYYASNSRDKRFFDLYSVQVGEATEDKVYPATMAYKNDKGLNPSTISNDDHYIALSEEITTNNSNMYLLDTQSGKTQLLSQHEGDAQFNPQYFSLDGSKLIYLTDEGSEFMYLATYEIATGTKSKLEELPGISCILIYRGTESIVWWRLTTMHAPRLKYTMNLMVENY